MRSGQTALFSFKALCLCPGLQWASGLLKLLFNSQFAANVMLARMNVSPDARWTHRIFYCFYFTIAAAVTCRRGCSNSSQTQSTLLRRHVAEIRLHEPQNPNKQVTRLYRWGTTATVWPALGGLKKTLATLNSSVRLIQPTVNHSRTAFAAITDRVSVCVCVFR